jgi:hypothetical protein
LIGSGFKSFVAVKHSFLLVFWKFSTWVKEVIKSESKQSFLEKGWNCMRS